MRLVKYSPFNDVSFFKNAFDDFFAAPVASARKSSHFAPAVDIINKKEAIELNVELPGVKKEDIKVNIEDRVLTIEAEHSSEVKEEETNYYRRERRFGKFKRAFTLSEDILTEEISADYKDGILTVALKKNTVKEEVKQITVN